MNFRGRASWESGSASFFVSNEPCKLKCACTDLNAKNGGEKKGGTMVQINGEQQDVALVAGKTLLVYVTEAGYDPVGIVIEKNMEIIHREDFDKVSIEDGDVIEILHFVGGGQF